MRAEYNVTYKEFLESMKGYRKVSGGAAYAYYLDMWIVPVIGVLIIGFFTHMYYRNGSEAADPFAFLPIVGVAAIIGPPIFYRLKLRQAHRERTALSPQGRVRLDFDEETVRFTIPDKAEVSYPWASFTKYIETEKVATLFVEKSVFHTIPKRAMDDEGWSALRASVQQHVRKS
jgi:hypothetical protein